MPLIVLAVLALIVQALLSLVVLLKNKKNLRNKSFFLLSMSLLIWAAASSYSEIAQDIWIVRLIMLFAAAQNCFFLLFSYSLGSKKVKINRKTTLYILLSILALTITMTPLLFSGLTTSEQGEVYPIAQPGMAIFILHATISISTGFRLISRAFKRSTGVNRRQLTFILLGSIVLWGIVPITNFALSLTLKTGLFVSISPIYALVFSALIAYAIIKHRLFDIKLAIARTITYLLVIFTMGVTYALIVFGSIGLLFGHNGYANPAQAFVYLTAAIFIAFTFNYVRRFFRKFTRSLFFQDAYETKLVLDQITSVVVRSINVNKLSRESLKILSHALKFEYSTIIVLGEDKKDDIEHVVATGRRKPKLDILMPELEKYSKPLIILDDIENESDHMFKTMQKSNVSVVARLETNRCLMGYMIFGYKESGNVYSEQDIELIRIVSDELAVAIQNTMRYEQIEHFNETLQHKIDEATKKLRQNNKKLHALDEAKDEFISMASHQLRTPLTSIKGYLSMALEGDAGKLNKDQKRLLHEAYTSSQRMVYMISDFLNVSRLKTGKFLIEPVTTDLPSMIEEEIEQLKPSAKGRGLTINTDIQSKFPILYIDENKIRQVIMNFIDNAIFYSKSGGEVDITLKEEDGEVIFTVQDYGIGIPNDELKDVFTKFFRASNARHVRPDGTGIGLFMAKKVITAHGGHMIFETKENKGSTFGFRIETKLILRGDSNKLKHKPDN